MKARAQCRRAIAAPKPRAVAGELQISDCKLQIEIAEVSVRQI
jgi:hypothetical protein